MTININGTPFVDVEHPVILAYHKKIEATLAEIRELEREETVKTELISEYNTGIGECNDEIKVLEDWISSNSEHLKQDREDAEKYRHEEHRLQSEIESLRMIRFSDNSQQEKCLKEAARLEEQLPGIQARAIGAERRIDQRKDSEKSTQQTLATKKHELDDWKSRLQADQSSLDHIRQNLAGLRERLEQYRKEMLEIAKEEQVPECDPDHCTPMEHPMQWLRNLVDFEQPFGWNGNGIDRRKIAVMIDGELDKFRQTDFHFSFDRNGDKGSFAFSGICDVELDKLNDLAHAAHEDVKEILHKEFVNDSNWQKLVCSKIIPEGIYTEITAGDKAAPTRNYSPSQLVEQISNVRIPSPEEDSFETEAPPAVSYSEPLGLDAFTETPQAVPFWFPRKIKLVIISTAASLFVLILFLVVCLVK